MSRYKLPYLELGRGRTPRAPGPTGSSVSGVLGAMRDDPFGFLLENARACGPVVRLPAGPRLLSAVMHLVAHPSGIRHVLVDHRHNYPKSIAYVPVRDLVGDGLVTSSGDRWASDRRSLQPQFTPQTALDATPQIDAAADRLLTRWDLQAQPTAEVDIAHDMRALAMDVLGSALLGVPIDGAGADEIGHLLTELLHDTESRMMSMWGITTLWNRFIPTKANRRAKVSLGRLREIAAGLFDEHGETAPDTVIGRISALRRQADGVTDDQAIDHVLTFLLAGHETTATTLTYACQLLAAHPEAQEKLMAEATEVVGGSPVEARHRPQLPFTEAVVKETMRLYPAAWVVERDAIEEDVIDGFVIPARGMVLISPYVTHRLPELWEAPDEFRPERFLGCAPPAGAYLPFGAGPRACIGATFATWEATALLARIFDHVSVHATGPMVQPEAAVTLRPSGPVTVEIRRR